MNGREITNRLLGFPPLSFPPLKYEIKPAIGRQKTNDILVVLTRMANIILKTIADSPSMF
jgi:hypothetical protein